MSNRSSRLAISWITASDTYPTSSCAYSSIGISAERFTGYTVTSLSKRAASSGEKIEFAIVLILLSDSSPHYQLRHPDRSEAEWRDPRISSLYLPLPHQ